MPCQFIGRHSHGTRADSRNEHAGLLYLGYLAIQGADELAGGGVVAHGADEGDPAVSAPGTPVLPDIDSRLLPIGIDCRRQKEIPLGGLDRLGDGSKHAIDGIATELLPAGLVISSQHGSWPGCGGDACLLGKCLSASFAEATVSSWIADSIQMNALQSIPGDQFRGHSGQQIEIVLIVRT